MRTSALLAGLLLTASSEAAERLLIKTRAYRLESVGYPPGWTVGQPEQRIDGGALLEANFYEGARWFEKEKPKDWAHAAVWRIAFPASAIPVPDAAWEKRLSLMTVKDDIECKRDKFPKIVGGSCGRQTGTLKVAGGLGFLFETDLTKSSPEVHERLLVFIAQGRRYVIKFYCPAGRAREYTPLLKLIAENFKPL
ncbi:MAG: hypothetical protein FD126_1020 [Elusimicrobia bacterium]|nr:MAG: hypothetical protein FD126_1020 [Elusimicrobiota bacterium]